MTASTARRWNTSCRRKACSVSSTGVARAGGFLNPHRDNSIPANAQRRFTMTVNLNAGAYEGGELRFREYGEELYAVERGTAVVWSASLLHEVLPVTKGRRLVPGVHMYAG
jgi:predicted 2-oxoglutarate/Fe(II)-dependent dioxygenase YbiX